jgi:small subunit ribosomal protein S6
MSYTSMPETTASRYELLYIIPSSLTDDEVSAAEAKVASILEKYGAKTEATLRLGKLKIAYVIKNERHGHYVLVHFTAEHPQLAKIEENLRITNEVLRHLIVRADEGDSKFELVPFQEVNLDAKEDRPRRRRPDAKSESKEETKEEASTEALSTEDVDKKIETALSEDQKDV